MLRDVLEITKIFFRVFTIMFVVQIYSTNIASAQNSNDNSKQKSNLSTLQQWQHEVASLTKLDSLSANFSQVNFDPSIDNGEKHTAFGIFYFHRPNLFRWEIERPEKSILISNGQKLYIYSPPVFEDESGQTIEEPLQKNFSLPIEILTGSSQVTKRFTVSRHLQPKTFNLTPKKPLKYGNRALIRALVTFAKIENSINLVYKLDLFLKAPNKAELQELQLSFSDYKLNPHVEKKEDWKTFFLKPKTTNQINTHSTATKKLAPTTK